ncbi:MAG: DoxX family protein [Blastocatellia bacterium]
MLKRLLTTSDDRIQLLLRLTLGLAMFPHGGQKLLGWFGGYGFTGTMGFMTGMGMPAVLAFLVIMGESLGAVGLIVGFVTRFCAFGILMIMVGAMALVHFKYGFFMNWSGQGAGEGYEYHLIVAGLALALMIRGGGSLSVDRAIQDRV